MNNYYSDDNVFDYAKRINILLDRFGNALLKENHYKTMVEYELLNYETKITKRLKNGIVIEIKSEE